MGFSGRGEIKPNLIRAGTQDGDSLDDKLQLPTFSSRTKDVLLGSLTTANKGGDAPCTDFTKRVNKTSNNLETGPDRSTTATSRQRVPRWTATRLTRLLRTRRRWTSPWVVRPTATTGCGRDRRREEKGLGTIRTKTGRGEGRQRGREGRQRALGPKATAARLVFQEDNNLIRPILSARFDSIPPS